MQVGRTGANAIEGIYAEFKSKNAHIDILGNNALNLLKLKQEINENKEDKRLIKYDIYFNKL